MHTDWDPDLWLGNGPEIHNARTLESCSDGSEQRWVGLYTE